MIDGFHLSGKFPKNGNDDAYPWPSGRPSRACVQSAQTLTWAAGADAGNLAYLKRFRREYGTVRGAVPPGLHVPDPRSSETLRAPSRRQLLAVEAHLPGTLDVHQHPLWAALDATTDMATCYRMKVTLERTVPSQLPVLLREERAHEAAEAMRSLDGLALLVLSVRILMSQAQRPAAFSTACCIVQALCFLAISRRFVAAMEILTEALQRTALADQSDGRFRITSDRTAFLVMYEAMSFVAAEIDRVTGVGELRQHERHRWPIYVEVLRHLVRAIATPGGEMREASLEAFVCAYGRDGQRKADQLARYPIFVGADE